LRKIHPLTDTRIETDIELKVIMPVRKPSVCLSQMEIDWATSKKMLKMLATPSIFRRPVFDLWSRIALAIDSLLTQDYHRRHISMQN